MFFVRVQCDTYISQPLAAGRSLNNAFCWGGWSERSCTRSATAIVSVVQLGGGHSTTELIAAKDKLPQNLWNFFKFSIHFFLTYCSFEPKQLTCKCVDNLRWNLKMLFTIHLFLGSNMTSKQENLIFQLCSNLFAFNMFLMIVCQMRLEKRSVTAKRTCSWLPVAATIEQTKCVLFSFILRNLQATFPLRACLVCAEWKAMWAQISKVGLASDWKHVFNLSCQYLCSARQNESTARGF